jgi:hypothetical protein
VGIELKHQLRAIAEALAGGHPGLARAYIDALNRAAAQLGEQCGKSDDLAARLRDHAQVLGKPGVAYSTDALVKALHEAADHV